MVKRIFLAAASMLAMAVAQDRCGSVNPPSELFMTNGDLQTAARVGGIRKRDTASVDLYMHVVETAATQGSVLNSVVQAQVDTLQAKYNANGIYFNQKAFSRSVNDSWATSATAQAETDMKTALHRGDYTALNIYVVNSIGGNLLGDCTFPVSGSPSSFQPSSPNYAQAQAILAGDGCRIIASTMPGASSGPYNLGYTAVHEVGHWFGILHTFQGDMCGGPGDYVDDTKNESTYTFGCPASKDSCPDPSSPAAQDPYHNFMDYSDDICMTNFTPGQIVRALSIFSMLRGGNTFAVASSAAGSSTSSVTGFTLQTSIPGTSLFSQPTTATYPSLTTSALVPSTTAASGSLTSSAALVGSSSASAAALTGSSSASAAALTGASSTSAAVVASGTSSTFSLSIQLTNNSTSLSKRQAVSYLTSTGFLTTNRTSAASYYISNGQLFGLGGGQISIDSGAISSPFDLTAPLGSVRNTFTLAATLRWFNLSTGRYTAFCVLSTGQVLSVPNGAAVIGCTPISLVPATSAAITTTTTNIQIGSITNTTIINNYFFYYPLGTTTYYDAQCGCTLTSTITSSCTATSTPVVTVYYHEPCACTQTSSYLRLATPAPITTAVVSGNSTIVSTITAVLTSATPVSVDSVATPTSTDSATPAAPTGVRAAAVTTTAPAVLAAPSTTTTLVVVTPSANSTSANRVPELYVPSTTAAKPALFTGAASKANLAGVLVIGAAVALLA